MADLTELKKGKPFIVAIIALLFDLRFDIGLDMAWKKGLDYYTRVEKEVQ